MQSDAPPGLEENVPLASKLTLGVGGSARYLCTVGSPTEARQALSWARRHQLEALILGGGSNLVCADSGFDGLAIQCALRGIEHAPSGDVVQVTAAAGEDWDEFVATTVAHGLAGIECLSGIPGRVGATPIQNVGAYGQEVKQTIVSVRCLDRLSLEEAILDNQECEFRYRDSRFKSREPDRFVVLSVTFALTPGGAPSLHYADLKERVGNNPTLPEVRRAVIAARREKSMVLDAGDPNARSCGSFFLNPVVDRKSLAVLRDNAGQDVPHYPEPDGRIKLPAAWLIERAGFKKGERRGRVGLSTRHALALVTQPGATARDVRDFAVEIKSRVKERFNIELHAEPRFVGFPPP